ncbi:uncharacterized protein LOC100898190 [Galendromus occidentalis]|uniref:Uncharacterized protein LOC100898190 n=1 Tax=Galendromus occidentalis TaxID=34638 RepID=A0AAJ6QY86_9ACAR|nr:uncharacterized protein LOC100898190 [Galendromus occidentalis]
MGVDDMDPGLRQLYLQKPYVKTTKKASLLATIFEEPVQKTKSKEPQLMAARGFKRYLDFESQSEFAKRRRKREQKAMTHQMQKQREQMAQAEPETQVNNCGRPKRRAASISEAATKVMTFFDSPPKPISREAFELSFASVSSKKNSATKDNITNDDSLAFTSSSGNAGKDKILKSRRRIAKPSRISREVRDVVAEIVEVAAVVDDLVVVASGSSWYTGVEKFDDRGHSNLSDKGVDDNGQAVH